VTIWHDGEDGGRRIRMLGGEGRRKGKIWDRKEIAKALGSTDT
jgi:hypothetical protein